MKRNQPRAEILDGLNHNKYQIGYESNRHRDNTIEATRNITADALPAICSCGLSKASLILWMMVSLHHSTWLQLKKRTDRFDPHKHVPEKQSEWTFIVNRKWSRTITACELHSGSREKIPRHLLHIQTERRLKFAHCHRLSVYVSRPSY